MKNERKFPCPFTHPQIERNYKDHEAKKLCNEDTQPSLAGSISKALGGTTVRSGGPTSNPPVAKSIASAFGGGK